MLKIISALFVFICLFHLRVATAQSPTPNQSVSESKTDTGSVPSPSSSERCALKEGCKHDSLTCTEGSLFEDGACLCGSIYFVFPGKGITCQEQSDHSHQLICTQDVCNCYGDRIKKGQACQVKTCNGLQTLSEEGCVCGTTPLQKGYQCEFGRAERAIQSCNQSEGCICGKRQCKAHETCYKDKCVDRISLKPIPEGYTSTKGLPRCESPQGCNCGSSTCEQGSFCINQICYHDPYFRKMEGKVFYYRLFDFNDRLDTHESYESYRQSLWSFLFAPEQTLICDLELGRNSRYCDETPDMTVGAFLKTCGETKMPKNVAQMYCLLSLETYKDGLGVVAMGWKEDPAETATPENETH